MKDKLPVRSQLMSTSCADFYCGFSRRLSKTPCEQSQPRGISRNRHSDGLRHKVVVESIFSFFTSNARFFVTPERCGIVKNVVAIDPNSASSNVPLNTSYGIDVRRE